DCLDYASMVRAAFRQARPLAEGQKARTSKGFHNTTPLRQPRQLAEGVEFLERYADFSPFEPSFGGRGSNHREKCKVLGCSLGTATGLGLHRAVHSGHLTSSPPFQVIMARMVFSSMSGENQWVAP